jgi:hypothetical protein
VSSYPWHTRDAINEAIQPLAKSYEVAALRSNVDRLECSLREACAEVDGLRAQCQEHAQGSLDMANLLNGLFDRVAALEQAALKTMEGAQS